MRGATRRFLQRRFGRLLWPQHQVRQWVRLAIDLTIVVLGLVFISDKSGLVVCKSLVGLIGRPPGENRGWLRGGRSPRYGLPLVHCDWRKKPGRILAGLVEIAETRKMHPGARNRIPRS